MQHNVPYGTEKRGFIKDQDLPTTASPPSQALGRSATLSLLAPPDVCPSTDSVSSTTNDYHSYRP